MCWATQNEFLHLLESFVKEAKLTAMILINSANSFCHDSAMSQMNNFSSIVVQNCANCFSYG